MKHGHFLAFFSIVRVLFRQWGDFLDFGEGIGYKTKFLQISIGSIGLYLILNLIFLAQEGLTNPAQGGNLRITLFLLVFLTATLSVAMSYRYKRTLA